ncbi:MAG: MCE family protein [Planctomycetes bacterium]|nr:MCE family protein [Planctomycetota bacterium]
MHSLRYLLGTLVLAGAVLGAAWFVHLLRNLDDRPGLPLQVEFRDARGLRAGADVRYRGVRVGTVRSVAVTADGLKATASLLLDVEGAAQACVGSAFWIVTPRFGGLTGSTSGLDTLVRDAYVAFETPAERGSRLAAGSQVAGRERPPAGSEPLDELEPGDLRMVVLVPENHGLRPGSPVVFRGMQVGDVRSVVLAADGSHVEVALRIARRHRQTVTDRCQFWVARPQLSGALFSGFTLTDANALLSPYVAYYGEPGDGVPVQDGHRIAAQPSRPAREAAGVPAEAMRRAAPAPAAAPGGDGLVLVRITYSAIERDTWSPDDPIHRQGTGTLFVDRAGRAVVVTARSLVDGAFTERDLFGTLPTVTDEQTKVMLPDGTVLRAGRVWVDGEGQDLALLLLEDAPPDLRGTEAGRLCFDDAPSAGAEVAVRCAGADGGPVAPSAWEGAAATGDRLGGATVAGDKVIGVVGRRRALEDVASIVPLQRLPADLRPR